MDRRRNARRRAVLDRKIERGELGIGKTEAPQMSIETILLLGSGVVAAGLIAAWLGGAFSDLMEREGNTAARLGDLEKVETTLGD